MNVLLKECILELIMFYYIFVLDFILLITQIGLYCCIA
jgi:hypothetical protein